MLCNILRIGKHFGKRLEATRNCRGLVTIHIIYFHNLINEHINKTIYLFSMGWYILFPSYSFITFIVTI